MQSNVLLEKLLYDPILQNSAIWPHNQCSPTHKVIALGLAQFAQLLHCGGGGTMKQFWAFLQTPKIAARVRY